MKRVVEIEEPVIAARCGDFFAEIAEGAWIARNCDRAVAVDRSDLEPPLGNVGDRRGDIGQAQTDRSHSACANGLGLRAAALVNESNRLLTSTNSINGCPTVAPFLKQERSQHVVTYQDQYTGHDHRRGR